MDIQVTFEDGTTELRAAATRCRRVRLDPLEESTIDDCRGATVWIMGRNGGWCRVETYPAQIARLTRERDAARADVGKALDRIGELVGMLRAVEKMEVDEETGETLFDGGPVSKIFARVVLHALTKAPNFYTFEVRLDGEQVAILTVQRPTGKTPEERYHEEKERADATENRLADLRGDATPWPLRDVLSRLADAADHLLNDHNCDSHGWEGVCQARDVARAVVARIDGKGTP